MNTRLFFLPALALGGAALLVLPSGESRAFSTIGGSLDSGQRDVRLFNNFADAVSNDNVAQAAQFPGYDGAELAIWKGIVEWGSDLHGDGTGDPVGGNQLGNSNSNFDAFWCGNANDIGTANQNIVSAIASCGGGTLAFTETPISDGWRIRFCENWSWADGPGTIGINFDIQGVMAHEYGHALGLGHSDVGGATMFPSVGQGATGIRSLAADDNAGAQFVYGSQSIDKPSIVATVADDDLQMITIHGANFDADLNDVWFTQEAVTAPGSEPRVRVLGVPSTGGGTRIDVAIPAAAGPGDVLVKVPGSGHDAMSNAFPTDLLGSFGVPPPPPFSIDNVSPSVIEALMPGTEQLVLIEGAGFDTLTSLKLGADVIDPSRYTIVDPETITLDMPQSSVLGATTLSISDGVNNDSFPIILFATPTPLLEVGNGEELNVVDRDNGLPIILSGPVSSVHYLYFSFSNLPSSNPWVNLSMGNNFSSLFFVQSFSIPSKGWFGVTFPPSSLDMPPGGGIDVFLQSFIIDPPRPWPVGNLQSIHFVP